MGTFGLSYIVTILCLGVAVWWGGFTGFYVAVVLGVLEVSLSFDNAVVNASVLKEMEERWQRIFLTVGILVAVFGMRLVLPVAVVAVVADMGMWDTAVMAFYNPETYSKHLNDSHVQIATFGGMFLLLVFLSFLFDHEKEHYWLGRMERAVSGFGRVDSFSVVVALIALLLVQAVVPDGEKIAALISGIFGIILFVLVKSVDHLFANDDAEDERPEPNPAEQHHHIHPSHPVKPKPLTTATRSGLMGFLYLEVLDASFSFDGVIGAFAITKDVVIIMLGLAIGAMFVRSMTVYLVKKGTLNEYIYLEHGAHYAIGVLAAIMLASTVQHIPEWVASLIGVAFIVFSIISSVRHRRAQAQVEPPHEGPPQTPDDFTR